MQVVIESAGDHRFDLNHLRQEGAAELLELALRKANLGEGQWRLQVQKKVTCNAETWPFAVVGYKPWCCYTKIKPGDNNSGHFCTLLMPPGRRGEEVFRALKQVEDDIDRNWRFSEERKARLLNGAVHAAPLEDEAAIEPTAGPDLSVWVCDPEKTRLTLLAIDELSRRDPWSTQADFASALGAEMGWQGASSTAVAGVFTALTRRGFISKRVHEARPVGYQLTDAGRALIRDLLPGTALPAVPPPVDLAFDPSEMLQTLDTLAREYAEAARQLSENRERRAQLSSAVEKLDVEARELKRKMNNAELQTLLRRLGHVPFLS